MHNRATVKDFYGAMHQDETREKLEELVQGAQKRSPVFDMVTDRTPATVTLEK